MRTKGSFFTSRTTFGTVSWTIIDMGQDNSGNPFITVEYSFTSLGKAPSLTFLQTGLGHNTSDFTSHGYGDPSAQFALGLEINTGDTMTVRITRIDDSEVWSRSSLFSVCMFH